MLIARSLYRPSLVIVVLLSCRSIARAQAAIPNEAAFKVSVSAGLWDHVPTDSEQGRHPGDGFDVSLDGRLGRAAPGALSIRAELGTGSGTGLGRPGFDYRRLIVGAVRPFISASRQPFLVYLSGGGGAYVETSRGARRIEPSVYGAIGLDVVLGSSPVSLGAEVQVHTIGSGLYGTTSLTARLRVK